MLETNVKIGDPIIFVDPRGKRRPALITMNWDYDGKDQHPCINLVFIHDDENRDDTYGRQIDRETSVTHKSAVKAHGNFWMYGDDRDEVK